GAFNLTASGTLQLVGIAGVTIAGQFSVAYNSTGPVFTLSGNALSVSAFGQPFPGNLTFTKNADGTFAVSASQVSFSIGAPGSSTPVVSVTGGHGDLLVAATGVAASF